jgi:hypothetical protein
MRGKAREFVLGARPGDRPRPRDLLRAVQELGWGVLAERQDREIVMGAVTRPWEPDVTFHAIPPLWAFASPGIWLIRRLSLAH